METAFLLGCAAAVAWNGIVWAYGWRALEARRWVARGALLVDARSVDEFARGHVDGSVSFSAEGIAAQLDRAPYRSAALPLGPHDRPIVVYSSSRARSAEAARWLRRAGYHRVLDAGAMSSW